MIAARKRVVVRAPARLDDWDAAEELRRNLRDCWLDEEVVEIRVDMRDTKAISVVGFAKLLLYHERMRQRGGSLVVVGLPDGIRPTFAVLRLDAVLHVEY